jgi:hypothetical protein
MQVIRGLASKVSFVILGIMVGLAIILITNLQFAAELKQGLRDADFGMIPPIGIYGPSAYDPPRK